MIVRDLYNILGIARDADQATIRKSFKKLARKYHPDLNKDARADERFKEVNAAYEVLGDESSRNLYDTFGEASLRPGFNPDAARQWRQASGGSGGPGGFGGFGGFGGGGLDIDDLLNAFGGRAFSGGRTRGAQSGGRQRTRKPPTAARGADIEQALHCTLEDLVSSEKKVVSFRRPSACSDCTGIGGSGEQRCPVCSGSGTSTVGPLTYPCVACSGSGHRFQNECGTCEGTGRVMKEERLKVKIPAGVQDGQSIRIRGKGAEGKRGGKAGDLLLAVTIAPHPWLERDGDDLRLVVPLTIHEAMAGAQVEVPTLKGRIRVKVPAGSSAGQQMRIRGRGLPKKSGKHGALYLVLQPTPPVTDTEDAARLAEELDAFYTTSPRAEWEE